MQSGSQCCATPELSAGATGRTEIGRGLGGVRFGGRVARVKKRRRERRTCICGDANEATRPKRRDTLRTAVHWRSRRKGREANANRGRENVTWSGKRGSCRLASDGGVGRYLGA